MTIEECREKKYNHLYVISIHMPSYVSFVRQIDTKINSRNITNHRTEYTTTNEEKKTSKQRTELITVDEFTLENYEVSLLLLYSTE